MGYWLEPTPQLVIVQGEDFYYDLYRDEPAQVITVTAPTGGTTGSFKLAGFGGVTADIDIAATAATLAAALAALPGINGRVSATGSAGGPWTATLLRDLAKLKQPLLTVNSTAFSHPDASVAVAYLPHDLTSYTAVAKLKDPPGTTSPTTYASLTQTVSADGQVILTAASGYARIWIKAAKTATFTAFTLPNNQAQLDLQLIKSGIVEAWLQAVVTLKLSVI